MVVARTAAARSGRYFELMVQSAVASESVLVRSGARSNPRWVGAALGVLVCLFPFADLALRVRTSALAPNLDEDAQASPLLALAQMSIVAALLIPILSGALLFGVDFRRAKFLTASLILFAISIPLSFLSLSDMSCFNYVLLIDYVSICAILLVSMNVDDEVTIRSFFSGVAITLGVAMIAVLVDHDYFWGRLMGRTAPNYWGGLALSTIIAAMAMRGWVLKSALIGLSLYVMYSAQSRADMVALVGAVSVAAILFTRHPRARRWSWMWFVAALALVAAIGLESDFISNDLLKLSDVDRGLGTGLTGRTSTWRETWSLFENHPWFGVGYRQHVHYMTSRLPAHNVYLATLADTGIVGFLGYSLFFFGALGRSLVRAWREPKGSSLAIAAFLSAFAIVGLVEPTGFHTGNSLSMLMIFIAAWAWRTAPARTGQWAEAAPPPERLARGART